MNTINYIKSYVNEINRICSIMINSLKLESKIDLINYRASHQSGEFCDKDVIYKFTFHGRGCKITCDNFVIDWDFGDNNFWCGIDPWKLADYINNNKKSDKKYDGYIIEKLFDELIEKKLMDKRDGLYYLNDI